MLNLVDELYEITAALESAGVTYAVCGGVAVSIHGAPRATKDIDILIARADLAKALDVVRPLGYAFPALPMAFEEGTAKERHVQRVSKLEGRLHLLLDFLLAEASLAGALDDRVAVRVPQGPLTVVSRETLMRMKRLAARPQDLADIAKLETPDET